MAQPKTKTYGAADPALTYTAGGLQFSDTAASVLTGTLTRAAGESVAGSPYAITQGTLAANGNYSLSFTGSTRVGRIVGEGGAGVDRDMGPPWGPRVEKSQGYNLDFFSRH